MCTATCRPLSCASTGKVRSVHLFPVLNLPHKFLQRSAKPGLTLQQCTALFCFVEYSFSCKAAFVLTSVLFDASR